MEISSADFLQAHQDCWITQRGAQLPVINIHAVNVAATPGRVFEALASPEHIAPGFHWRVLLRVRAAMGKLFAWDVGIAGHGPQPLVPGNHYFFFRIEHVAGPKHARAGPFELGLSVENKLTLALMSLVVAPADGGSRLFNVTCAVFKGRLGRAYWRAIRPFHDALVEDSLAWIRRRAEVAR